MTKYYLLLLSTATLLLTAAYTYDAPGPITAQAAPVPQNSQEQWAYDLAVALGNTQPTGDTIRFLVAWQRAEGTSAAYNPLATSQDMPGATIFNSHGVKEYLSYQDGITATAITLGYDYSGYVAIREGIRTNDVALALQGLYASPWGTNPDNVAALYNSAVSSPAPLEAMTAQQGYINGGKVWPTLSTQINAGFYTADCQWWGFQAGCQHFGTDIAGGEGDPVYMPFDGTFLLCKVYPDYNADGTPSPYKGVSFMATLADGSELYIGHMRAGLCDVAQGTPIGAGTQIGTMRGDTAHVHVQMRDSAGNLIDFASYWNEY